MGQVHQGEWAWDDEAPDQRPRSDDLISARAAALFAPFRSVFGVTVLLTVIFPLLALTFVYGAALVITVCQSLLEAYRY